ncbi:MAG: hypothetical protein ABI361_08900 [Nitrososphaera sp.]|jgi:hypothetical protein
MQVADLVTTLKLSKLFDRKQCRSCGSKITVKKLCLTCNEPSSVWCENCFTIEEYGHVGHLEIHLL